MSTKKSAAPTDWKSIAEVLAQRVMFAIDHLKGEGAGVVGDLSKPSSEWQHWRDYFADAIEMIPGVKIDRELMHIRNLPRSKRDKAYADIIKRRAAAGG